MAGYVPLIDLKLNNFLRDFSIAKWPLDCVALIKRIRDEKRLPLQISTVRDVSDKFDAVSRYVEEENLYQIIINRDKIRYPFQDSRDRRLNFTIAHELGHILLDHLSIPDILKTDAERDLEDLEANEFAGKLLIPEKTLLQCNFVSIPAVAEFFNVSNTALWIRLNNLQRLDLLESKITRVCNKCGNTQFHGAKTILTALKENRIMKPYPLKIVSTRPNVHTAVKNIFTGQMAFAPVVTGGCITTAIKDYILTKVAAHIPTLIMEGIVKCAGVRLILIVWGF